MEGERWIPIFMGMTYRELGMTYGGVGMTEGLKLTILTYNWGKCVKPVGK